jgi:hypothetical protein
MGFTRECLGYYLIVAFCPSNWIDLAACTNIIAQTSHANLFAVEHLLDGSGRVRLGSLEGHTESSVPDELGDNTECSRDTKEDSVEVLLVETVANHQQKRVSQTIKHTR